MAKASKTRAAPKKAAAKKTKAPKPAAGKKPSVKKTATRKPAAKPAARKPAAAKSSPAGFDGLTKLVDHPLVSDLLAVGAMAAVAAIADHNVRTRTGEAKAGSSKAVKAAGVAAAAAIGKRLLTEVEEIRKVSKAKPKPKR